MSLVVVVRFGVRKYRDLYLGPLDDAVNWVLGIRQAHTVGRT